MKVAYKTASGKEFDNLKDAKMHENTCADYREQFEEHCRDIDLVYSFERVGKYYSNIGTTKAYILYKTML